MELSPVCLTFGKTLSYPGSALQKLSVSLQESLSAAGGLVALLVLPGAEGNTEDCDEPERHNKLSATEENLLRDED